MANFSPHIEVYRSFWKDRFPEIFSKFIDQIRKSPISELVNKYLPNNIKFDCEIKEKGISEQHCCKAGTSYIQSLFVKRNLGEREPRIFLGNIPKITDRGTFIINGVERAIVAKLEPSPGLFFEKQTSKDGKTWNVACFRPTKQPFLRRNYFITFESKDGLTVSINKNKVPPLTLLRSLGFSDDEFENIFDEDRDLLQKLKDEESKREKRANSKPKLDSAEVCRQMGIDKFEHKDEADYRGKIKEVCNALLSENYFSYAGRWQINRKLKRVDGYQSRDSEYLTKDDIYYALKYLLKTAKNDDQHSLANNRIRLVDELILDAVESSLNKAYKRLMGEAVGTQQEFIDALRKVLTNGKVFEKEIERFFTLSKFSRLVPQDNALAASALARRIEWTCPHGISKDSIDSISSRQLHWSHRGRICPVDTSQSDKIGLALSLTKEAKIDQKNGQILAPFRKVRQQNKTFKIESKDLYLSAGFEEALMLEGKFIAYSDMPYVDWNESVPKNTDDDSKVIARSGADELKEVEFSKIAFVESPKLIGMSLAASMIPFIEHNDVNRAMMGCNAMRQALPLKNAELPVVSTKSEGELLDYLKSSSYGKFLDNCPAFGTNALVAFIPWEGLNFEDAIVISEDFSEYLTSIHTLNSIDVCEFIVGEGKDKKIISENTKQKTPFAIDKLDENGIIEVGEEFVGGDVLVYKEKPVLKDGNIVFEDNSVKVPDDLHGKVVSVEILEHNLPLNVLKRIIIKVERKVTIGDKLSNRHGGKGVISAILPKKKMPYIIDPNSGKKQYVDAILNPLGVISRLNPGQLYETHLGLVSYLKDIRYELDPFSQKVIKISAEGVLEEFDVPDMRKFVKEELESIESANEGKIPLFHPDNPEKPIGRVVVGLQYLMKLNHLAEKKEHGRGSGRHYDMITSQPIQSRRLEHSERLEGGARVGEMEVWALSSHSAHNLLQEFFTLKSDNPSKRRRMKRILSGELRQRYPRPDLPEAVRSFIWLLRGLCLDVVFFGEEQPSLLYQKKLKPEQIEAIQVKLASQSEILSESEGEVKLRDFGKLDNALSPGGLLEPSLFCDEKGKWLGELPPYSRTKMGHIALEREVIHPLFFSFVAELFGISQNALLAIISRRKAIPFSSNDQIDGLIRLCWEKSNDFKNLFSGNIPGEKPTMCIVGYVAEDTNLRLEDWLKKTNLQVKKSAINSVFQMCSGVSVLCDVLSCFDSEFIEVQLDKAQREFEEQQSKKEDRESRANRIKRLERQIRCHQILLDNEWTGEQFLIKNLPVVPVTLRYPYLLSADRISRNDLHILYEDVIKYNDKVRTDKQLLEDTKLPQTFRRDISTRRLPGYESQLQLAVDALYTNRQRVTSQSGRRLKSILDMLVGKNGLCRRKMVGKRIDYSARAVIVPGLDLQIDECGIPLKIAIKLFRDILLRNCERKSSRDKPGCFSEQAEMLERVLRNPESSDRRVVELLLSKLFEKREYPVLLNRQPTLHRLGVQAFFPKLTEHYCIAVHPLITAGFGADFDGDTMAVYLPITPKAREDARQMINRDVRSPANGDCTLNLSQDITLGLYWLCHFGDDKQKQELRDIVGEFPESQDEKLRDWIGQKITELSGTEPPTLPSCKWKDRIQRLQTLLFKSATQSGLSFGVFDFPTLSANLSEVEQKVEKALDELDSENSLKVLYKSKARGSLQSFTTLIASRQFPHPRKNEQIIIDSGLITGYRSGEFFASCYGSRATQVDKNLNTGVAGGLYKRLVSITEGLFITEEDCQTKRQNRSPVTCQSKSGICQKCYGNDHSTGKQVEIGTAVGLLAAQSIGERGTQLTISAFHTGERMIDLIKKADEYFNAKTDAMDELSKYLDSLSFTKDAQQIREVPQNIVDKVIIEGSKIYESVNIEHIHFKVILKAMLDYVKLKDGRIVHRQVYESQEDKQKGVQCLVGVRDAIYYHPGWLAQIAGANRVNRLVEILAKSVLEGERDFFMMPREQLMFGKRISKPSKEGEE